MSRRSSSFRLAGWVGLLVVLTGALSVTAFALTRGDGPKPPNRPLPQAIHAALVGKPVAGVSATVKLSQDLLPGSSSLVNQGAGATGRLWIGGGRARLHLSSPLGVVDVAFDGRHVTLWDHASNTAYRYTLPPHRARHQPAHHRSVPSVAQIAQALAHVSRWADVSAAQPGTIAGRPAYTVRVSPRHAAGLLGAAELAWDSQHGTPLRFAIYPTGSSTAAIELAVTDIHYGRIAPAALGLRLAPATQIVPVSKPAGNHAAQPTAPVAGIRAVAPASAGGWTRTDVRPLRIAGHAGALVVYGHGLGAIVVLEQPATPAANGLSKLPTASIGGTPGRVLETTLGSAVRFTRGGVTFTVAGFQTVETVERVAAGLR